MDCITLAASFLRCLRSGRGGAAPSLGTESICSPAAAAAPGSPQQAVSRLTSPRHVRYDVLCKVDTSYLVTRVFMSFSYFQSGLSLVFDWILWSFHAYCFV